MTTPRNDSLSVQKESLRARLLAQRLLIAQQLDVDADNGYPRSTTMRFLKRSTVPAVTMVGGIATLFGGLRLYRAITAVMTVVGTLRASSNRR